MGRLPCGPGRCRTPVFGGNGRSRRLGRASERGNFPGLRWHVNVAGDGRNATPLFLHELTVSGRVAGGLEGRLDLKHVLADTRDRGSAALSAGLGWVFR